MALAARELVRKAVECIGLESDCFQQTPGAFQRFGARRAVIERALDHRLADGAPRIERTIRVLEDHLDAAAIGMQGALLQSGDIVTVERSEEHTSELQSLMRISYAVFCLKKKKNKKQQDRQRKKIEKSVESDE